MQVLDSGTKSLSDHEVLAFIKDQLAAYETEPKTFQRPGNYLRALQRHREHLEDRERPFLNNPEYDSNNNYMFKLMESLESSVQLTKTEMLMLINHRPSKRELLLPMIEDIDTRFTEEQQQLIVDTVTSVLGSPGDIKAPEGQADTTMDA